MLAIRDSVFENNASGIAGGGAINNWVGGKLEIVDTIFRDNSANSEGSGGALTNRGYMFVDRTGFFNNYADNVGGALAMITGAELDSNIANSTFGNNHSRNEGGAVFNFNGSLTIDSSIFVGNKVDIHPTHGYGGALINKGSANTTISDSKVFSNLALSGGAFYNSGGATLTVNKTCIEGNGDIGVENVDGQVVATLNWWGDSSGPSGAGPGSGDSVSGNVNFADFSTASECPFPEEEDITLGVPRFAQTQDPWGTMDYDFARSWAESGEYSISVWGCALSTAVSVLNYYGVNSFYGMNDPDFPDGTPINPGTLNAWLIKQPYGFLRQGTISWSAISLLTKQINVAKSDSIKLEFRKYITNDFTRSDQLISEGKPDIWQLVDPLSSSGSHFVVTNGVIESSSEYAIVDPFFERSSVLSDNVQLRAIDRFLPTNSNFSYLVVHTDEQLMPVLIHEDGSRVGIDGEGKHEEQDESWYWLQNPLNGYVNGNVVVSGERFDEIGIPTPDDGKYELVLSTEDSGFYKVEVYAYDSEANGATSEESYFVSQDLPRKLVFDYTQNPGGTTLELTSVVSFDQLVLDIKFARKNGWIKNQGLAVTLTKLTLIAKHFQHSVPKLTKTILSVIDKYIDAAHSRNLTEEGRSFLSQELQWLRQSL